MEKMPLFSIITVCYNSAGTIEETIKSVLAQDFCDFEYLVIDGGSNDCTVDIIKEYEPLFKGRMRWISEPDRGLYDAMNKAVRMAEGRYIEFINSDDKLIAGSLKEIANQTSPNADTIVYGDSVNIYENGEKKAMKTVKALTHITEKTLIFGMGVIHQSMFCGRKVFDSVGCFNMEYSIGADWDFLIRCIKNNIKMVYCPVAVTEFSIGGVSSKVHNIQRHKIRKANKLYKVVDVGFIRDIFNIKCMIQLILGEKLYRKLRYTVNKNS